MSTEPLRPPRDPEALDYEALGRLAARWVLMDAERKMRRDERNRALALLANALDCPMRPDPEETRSVFAPATAEQRELHDHAARAGVAYDAAFPRARGLRAAMSRMVWAAHEKPAPDAELVAACDAAIQAACDAATQKESPFEHT